MAKEAEKTASVTNRGYFAALEKKWGDKARKNRWRNKLEVVQRPDDEPHVAPRYDVILIDQRGKAKRIGGFSGTDSQGLATAYAIPKLGIEGINLYREKGFRALFNKASGQSS